VSTLASYGHQLTGMIGVALIIGSYLALTTDRMRSDGLWYPLLNGSGALLILFSLSVDFNLSAAVVELFWVLISAVGVWRWHKRRTATNVHLSDADNMRKK
jgi:hypothetical protein